jgi:hypothetical protein
MDQTATLLTLLVVPVFYTFFDDAQLVTGRDGSARAGVGSKSSDRELYISCSLRLKP